MACFLSARISSFNSIVVRLKAIWISPSRSRQRRFNSIVVRLKGMDDDEIDFNSLRFNSIVVRLKVVASCGQAPSSPQFQFHSGSIKSTALRRWRKRVREVSIP